MCKIYQLKGFENYYVDFLQTMKSKARYIDPDMEHTKGINSEFYNNIAKFLNEKEHKGWEYTVCGPVKGNEIPSGIKVTKVGAGNNIETVVYLRSDQFGFSANENIFIKNDERYPLVKLNNICSDEYTRKFIAGYIKDTRTLGGSFIWPLFNYEKKEGKYKWKSMYNWQRGIDKYIEDRVDLTLLEIKHFYELYTSNDCKNRCYTDIVEIFNNNYKNDLLLKYSDKEKIVEWLSHFETFKNYVDFFMLNPFVVKKGEEYYPIDIIKSEIVVQDNKLKANEKLIVEVPEIKEIQSMNDKETIKKMLTNVRLLTLARSKMMEAFMEGREWEKFDPKWKL